MYIIEDSKVLEYLHKTINAFSKIGEYINLVAKRQSLEFTVVNSSRTVLGRASFSSPLIQGEGGSKSVYIKARAADFVFRRLENEQAVTLQLQFQVTRTGQEQIELKFDSGSGVKKLFRLPCLQTALSPIAFEPIGQRPYTIECLPRILRDAFASCETGADEIKMSFQRSLVNLIARKRGKVKAETQIMRSGLRTIINLQPETFRQITVKTPRQLDFKLKEFRVMLAFFDQLGDEIPIQAKFNDEGPTTPLAFRAGLSVFQGMNFDFKFLAKSSVPRIAGEHGQTVLRVGPQPNYNDSDFNGQSPRHTDLLVRQALKEKDRRLRRLAVGSRSAYTDETQAFFGRNSASQSNDQQSTVEEPNIDISSFDAATSEVGSTQGAHQPPVRGLFD